MEPLSETITFRYECTPRERREGQRALSARHAARRRVDRGRVIRAWCFIVGGVIAAVLFQKNALKVDRVTAQRNGSVVSAPTPEAARRGRFAIIGVGAGLCLWTGAITYSIIAVGQAQGRLNTNLDYSITVEGIREARGGTAMTRKWSRFIGIEATPLTIVLRLGGDDGVILPKRLLGDETRVATVFAVLQQRISKPAISAAIGFPVITP